MLKNDRAPHTYSLYLGPHSPLSVPLQKLLSKNSGILKKSASEFPNPRFHREFLTDFLKQNDLVLDAPLTHQRYVDAILEDNLSQHIIFNYDAFLGSRKSAIHLSVAYPALATKVEPLRRLFCQQNVVIFLCLQPYHKFVDDELSDNPELCEKLITEYDQVGFSWLPFIVRLRSVFPEATYVILEEEELGKDWAAIVELISRSPSAAQFEGIDDFSVTCLNNKGRKKYRAALRDNERTTVQEWLTISRKFFAQYGREVPPLKRIFPSLWSSEQIQRSQLNFDEDMMQLDQTPNVTIASDLIKDLL